jgi:hypothetical protein
MMSLVCLFCNAQLLLHNLSFDAEIGQLIPQALVLYPQSLPLPLADLNLLI